MTPPGDPLAESLQEKILYLRKLASDIQSGGWPVVMKKATKAFDLICRRVGIALNWLGALAIYGLVVLCRPFVCIRFVTFRSSRIGHFAINTEMFLCDKDDELRSVRRLDIFFYCEPISNGQLALMWQRVLRVYRLPVSMMIIFKELPGVKPRHYFDLSYQNYKDGRGQLKRSKPHLFFTEEEKRRGTAYLRKCGVEDTERFACLLVRDRAYLDAALPEDSPKGWRYHDYRDSDVDRYQNALLELADRGYTVFRMGAIVAKPLGFVHPRIIDYATSGDRTEFLDIFLAAHCRFFITTGTGLDSGATVFRKPVLYTNYTRLDEIPSWGQDDMLMLKLPIFVKENRTIPVAEMIARNLHRIWDAQTYKGMGLEWVENSEEEILASVVEMVERLDGAWRDSEVETRQQKLFETICRPKDMLNWCFSARLATTLLRKHPNLLGE